MALGARDEALRELAVVKAENEELRTLAKIGTWHNECRPNRQQATKELAKSQAIIDKLADTITELRAASAVPPAQEAARLKALAMKLQSSEHWKWINGFENGEFGSTDGHSHDGNPCIHPDCVLVRSASSAVASPAKEWQPIYTHPERRKIMVFWINAHGKKRTTFAAFWPVGTLDMGDEVPEDSVDENGKNTEAGWWEESEANDDSMWRLIAPLTHWQDIPAAPEVKK